MASHLFEHINSIDLDQKTKDVIQQVNNELRLIRLTAHIDIEDEMQNDPHNLSRFTLHLNGWPKNTPLCKVHSNCVWIDIVAGSKDFQRKLSLFFPGWRKHLKKSQCSFTFDQIIPEQIIFPKQQLLEIFCTLLKKPLVEFIPVLANLSAGARRNLKEHILYNNIKSWHPPLKLGAKGNIDLVLSGTAMVGAIFPLYSVDRIADSARIIQ